MGCHGKEAQMWVAVVSQDWNIHMPVSSLTVGTGVEKRCLQVAELSAFWAPFSIPLATGNLIC